MHISRIQLENIRSFETASIAFSPGINILLGANNSGKSTILKCIQKLQQMSNQLSGEDVRKTKQSGLFHIRLSNISKEDHSTFKTSESRTLKYASEQSLIFNMFSANRKDERLIVDPIKSSVFYKNGKISIEPKQGVEKNDFYIFSGFAEMENQGSVIYPFLSKRKNGFFTQQGGKDATYRVESDFRYLPAKIQKLSNGSHRFASDFKKLCLDILGFTVGIVPGEDGTNQDKLGIYVNSNEIVYLESMGEGVANILGLLAILLTEDNKIFIIEELENDIHPLSLKKLLNFIISKSKNNQIIISTHSHIVLKFLATVPASKIFFTECKFIKKEKGKPILLPKSTLIEVDNQPEVRLKLLERLGYEVLDFDLYKSYLLFEESSAEQLVRDFLIPQFVPSLIGKLRTVASNGADDLPARVSDLIRLFTFLHTNPIYQQKAWVIADGDDAGRKNITALSSKFKTWPKKHFIALSKKNIEEYYPEQFYTQFQEINTISKKDERFTQKNLLTTSIMTWISQYPKLAKTEFSKSASELISILKEIDKALTSN